MICLGRYEWELPPGPFLFDKKWETLLVFGRKKGIKTEKPINANKILKQSQNNQ
jgi:hypothetical protein